MQQPKLDIAFWDYDRTRALSDGRVRIDGAETTFHGGRIVTEIFGKMVRRRAYHVSELGLTYLLRTFHDGDSPFRAIPVFPNRAVRHGAIYINRHCGITRPEDLAGKRIGELALYGHDAGVMLKGILSDAYGIRPEQSRWLIGGIDFPMSPIDFVPRPTPQGVEVQYAHADQDLGKMLEQGQIDALISADIPRCILDRSPHVGRLFMDYEQAERDYFARTGIFPIMHTVVVTRELAQANPDLVKAVYRGFCDAKDWQAQHEVEGMTFNNMDTMHPWKTSLIERNRALLGGDWWPYGIGTNRAALDAVLRYHYEQGLTPRQLRIEDVFVPELLDT